MARNEQIGHLVDVLIRRTSLAFRGLVTGELLNEVADVLSGPLGWDAATRSSEITHAQEVLKRFHGVQVHSLVCLIDLGARTGDVPGARTARFSGEPAQWPAGSANAVPAQQPFKLARG